MTTPSGSPTLSLATDKDTYAVGDTIVVTASYADSTVEMTSLVVSASAVDGAGNNASAQTTVQVGVTESGSMDVSATDSFGDVYTLDSNDGTGTAVLRSTVGAPPAV